MSETVHVHYVIGDTVLEETHTADKVTFQHWPDGRAQIRLHNNGRITDWIAYRHAHRIHRTTGNPAPEERASFDPDTVRLNTRLDLELITAECLLPGCGWTMTFSWGAQRLSTITETCEQHPCKAQPAPEPSPPPKPRRRLKACVQRWPGAEIEGDYDPRCCRFPKSCSASVYDDAHVTDADLEDA